MRHTIPTKSRTSCFTMNKVAILHSSRLISGGGAGHEPGFAGFTGRGLLTGAVSGDIFASPSARQVYGAVKASPSTNGTILIITNCAYGSFMFFTSSDTFHRHR